MQSLNLIPQQEIQEQTQTKVLKLSTILSVLILIAVSGVSAYFIYYTTSLKSQTKSEQDKITSLRNDIASMSEIEVSARNLDKKYLTLQGMLSKRAYFSKLMREIRARKPSEIHIESFTVLKENKFSISGQAQTYIVITQFGNNLLSGDYAAGDPALAGVFKSIVLNQVDLSQSGKVEFAMTIEFDPAKLTYVK